MGVRFRVSEKGLVQFKDSGSDQNSGISPNTLTTSAVTATSTLSTGGCYTVSGSAVVTLTLPNPANVPGMLMVIRSLSAHAHIVSATLASAGGTATGNGAVITLPAAVGASFIAQSDGLRYVVLGQSGSITFSG